MLNVLIYIILLLYSLSILFVLCHAFFDAHLIFHYLRDRRKKKEAVFQDCFTPVVTIQLPVYNELHVVERLLEAVAVMDYPADKLEIQVLDDSTDETSAVIAGKVAALQHLPFPIQHIQRQHRDGFKAGALRHALNGAKGEFVAVFDADFIPSPDFLKRTIPFFKDPSIGMVQTKWGHLNKDASLFARLQAMALDGHFSVEQGGRNAAGYFINFNGTAGIWRKQTILDAGNWQADTLTEDFDLSYRAQMKGWKFKYLEDLVTPAELPPLISALKSQQFRWTKGGAETARKNLKTFYSLPLPFAVKVHGIFHLIYSFGFVSIFSFALLTVPLLFINEFFPQYRFALKISDLAGIGFFIYLPHYFISYYINARGSVGQRIGGFVFHFPLFSSLFIGLSLNNAIGIVQGYLGIKSGFVRTPKFNTISSKEKAMKSRYAETKVNWLTFMEAFLSFYFLFGIIQAIYFDNYKTIPVLLMAFSGFFMIFWLSIEERRKKALLARHD